jgi:hypothetical protein
VTSWPAIVLAAVGLAALRGGLRCHYAPEKAGIWLNPWSAVAAITLIAACIVPYSAWLGPRMVDVGTALVYMFGTVAVAALYGPLVAYHAGELLARGVSPEPGGADEPEDPFARARAAEERRETGVAVERYAYLLEREPRHVEARVRLARLLAETGRANRALEALEAGLALEGLAHSEKAPLRRLKEEVESSDLVDRAKLSGVPAHPMGDVKTARMSALEKDAPPPEGRAPA